MTPAASLAVACAIARDDGRTLVIQRAPGRPAPGYWTPVTGRLEPGESLEDAARREALEETGLPILPGPELCRSPAEGVPFVLAYLLCRLAPHASPDRLVLLESEVSRAAWVTRDQLPGLTPMFEATRRFYDEVFPWGK